MKLYLREFRKEEVATLIGDVVEVEESAELQNNRLFKNIVTPLCYDYTYTFSLSEAYCFDAFIDKEIEIWFEDNNNVLWYSIGEIEEVTEEDKKVVIIPTGPFVNKQHQRLNLSAE